jgi:NADH:ubiquinone reductase (H+-translocating)
MPDDSGSPRVVIIGGGFGGLEAAQSFRGAAVQVTLLDSHNYHLFQPLLYQVATASLSPGDIASPIRWVLRHQQNVQVFLAEARAVDPDAHCIVLDPGPAEVCRYVDRVPYDYLIVAAGATHSYFGHPEWADRAPGLKTLDDALEMRRQVLMAFEAAEREIDPETRKRLLTFLIVGGGPTGVELAGALGEIARRTLVRDFRSIRPESARILLIEGGPDVLPTFPPRLREAARESLARLGVEVRTNSVVTEIDPEGVSIGSQHVAAKTVLWAAGVQASPLARSLGVPLDRAGRVLAERTLAAPGRPGVFVIGDVCAFEQDGAMLPGVAQVAKQEGAHAAANILRAIAGKPLLPFRYRDYGTMATIGRGSAVAVVGPLKASGFFAWIMWIFIHVFWLIGFRNRVAVFSEWVWAYATLHRRIRLITGEPLWAAKTGEE